MQVFALFPVSLQPVRGNHQQMRDTLQRQFMDAVGDVHAVHARHLPIQQDQGIRRIGLGRPHKAIQGLLAGSDRIHTESEADQDILKNGPRRLAVIHHQEAFRARRVRIVPCVPDRPIRKRQAERERAAFAGFAAHLKLAAHHPYKALTDDQAESRPSVFAGDGAVGLFKGLEQACLLFLRQADARIIYGYAQGDRVRAPAQLFHAQHHPPLFRELDGVAQKVGEHLRQPQKIAFHSDKDVGGHVKKHFDIFAAHQGSAQIAEIFHQLL